MQGRSKAMSWLIPLLAIGLLLPAAQVFAQEESPAAGEVIRSVSRDQVTQQIRDHFKIEEPGQPGGTVVVGEVGDITTLNALLSDDSTSFDVVGRIYEALIGVSPIDGQIVPGLADSYEIAPDGVTYTFHLNTAAKWHDGTDVTAEDVKFSFDRRLDPVTGGSYQSLAAPMVASYRVIDEDTFEVVAVDRLATFFYDVMTVVLIIPKHIWEPIPVDIEAWQTDPGSTGEDAGRVIGTGPFKFESREEGVQITLVRNDDYYDGPATIDRVIYQFFEDSGTAVQALKTFQIDILESVDFQEVEPLRATGDHTVDVYDSFSFNWFITNQDPEKSTLFLQREVRQALMYSIDRDEINESIFFGYGQRAIGTQPKLSFAYAPDQIDTDYLYDPEKAKQLLDQAGWIDSNGNGVRDKDGQEFEFEYSYFAGVSSFDELAAYLQQAWGALGLKMTPKPLSDDAFFPSLDEHDFDIAFFGFGFDASGNQGFLFRCDAYENGFNYMKYCNPEYDALDDQQLRELDPAKRRELLIQLSNIANNDQAAGIFRLIETRTAYTNRLHNFRPNGYDTLWSLGFVWVEE